MIYKLRNPGGVESWFTKEQADILKNKIGWSVVSSKKDDDTTDEPHEGPTKEQPPVQSDAPIQPASLPDTEDEPKKPATKKGKGR